MLQNNLNIFNQARTLSGGTYSSLMRRSGKFIGIKTSCMFEQDKVNLNFTNFIALSDKSFKSWQDAWIDFIQTL